MQLDDTRIVVRERNFLDILDVSLHVMRTFSGPLALTFLVVAGPLFLLNELLIGWMSEPAFEDDRLESTFRFWWAMSLLVFIEAQLASSLSTLFLGQAMFFREVSMRSVLADAIKLFPRVFVCQILLRGVLVALLLVLFIERHHEFTALIEFIGLPLLALGTMLLRSLRPFLSELVLLERNPLRSRNQTAMTVARRSASLHGVAAGDLFARWMGSVIVAMLLIVSLSAAFYVLSGVLFNGWGLSAIWVRGLVPLSMWVTAAYMAVVRYLSYLDLRIRNEGWEVELLMRAEAARLANQLS